MVIDITGIHRLFSYHDIRVDIRRDNKRIIMKFSESNFKGIVVGTLGIL